MPRQVPLLLASAACAWALALPLAAIAVWLGASPWRELAWAVYGFGQAICHQRPERSFAWADVPWPVCARCTGLYLGAALGALLGWRRPAGPPVPAALARRWLVVAALPAALTVVFEWSAGRPPSNLVRWASGVVIGATAAALAVRMFREGEAAQRGVGSEVN